MRWRIRAVRKLYGDIPTGMPRVTYGAWSDWFTNFNPPFIISFNPPYSLTPAELALAGTVSGNVVSTPASPQAHELLPGLQVHRQLPVLGRAGLHRHYDRALPRLRLHGQPNA